MKIHFLLLGLIAGLASAPLPAFAANWPKNPAPSTATPSPMPAATPSAQSTPAPVARPLPFQGKISNVDPGAMTFTITTKQGKAHVHTITSKTKILKDDAPVAIADLKAEEIVRGSRLKLGEGRWEALKVIIGAKKPAVGKPEADDAS